MQRRGTAHTPHLEHVGFTNVPAHNRTISAYEYATLSSSPGESSSQSVHPPHKKIHVLLERQSSVCPSRGLQPILENISVSVIPSYSIRCLLLSPAMRSKVGIAKQTVVETCAWRKSPPLVTSLVGWLACFSSWTS